MKKWFVSCMVAFIVLLLANSQVIAIEPVEDDLVKIVKELLPEKAELIKPNEPATAHSIQEYDFDQDGKSEMIVTYRTRTELNRLHTMLLKKVNQQWEKIWEKTSNGFDIQFSGFKDLTGDGVKEYIIAWGIGASVGNQLEVYRWDDGTMASILTPRFYHKMELLSVENQTSLALWERYCCGDAFLVDVLTWENENFVTKAECFRQYYPKVKAFYNAKIKEMDAWFYWYVLADAQLKANLLDEATESIQIGLSFMHGEEEFAGLGKRLEEKLSSKNDTIE